MNLSSKKSIIELLRAKTGVPITKFAKNNRVTRQSVYEAINGKGSRRIRVEIAKSITIPPSMIWAENDYVTKTVDDLHYLGCNHD